MANTIEAWRFTINCDKLSFDNFLRSRYEKCPGAGATALIMPQFAINGAWNYSIGHDRQVLISITIEDSSALNVLMLLKKESALPVVEWLARQITSRYGFNLNHWGDTELDSGAIMHEWRFDALPPQTVEALIASLPGQQGTRGWWAALLTHYLDPAVQARMPLTQENIAIVTQIPISTVRRKIKKG